MEEDTLEQLVRRAQGSDLEAYGHLVRRFRQTALVGAARLLGDQHLAEDAVQEAFVDAFAQLDTLRQPAAFPGWFKRIVHGRCHRLVRGKHLPTVDLDRAGPIADSTQDQGRAFEERQVRAMLLAAVGDLPTDQRTIVTLFYFRELPQKEIAALLDIPVTTANNRLHDSRKRLRKELTTMIDAKSTTSFVHLHIYSEYSFDGGSRVSDLVEAAATAGMEALALTDRNNLCGAIKHYKACQAAGLKPILGCELQIAQEDSAYPLVLLVKNKTGFSNLLKLVSQSHTNSSGATIPSINLAQLEQRTEGLVCLSGGTRSLISVLLAETRFADALQAATALRALFADNFFLEIQRDDNGASPFEADLLKLHRRLRLPLIATCPPALPATPGEASLASPHKLENLFADLPAAVIATATIAAQCQLELEFGRSLLPEFPVPTQHNNADAYLSHLAHAGLAKRYDPSDKNAAERLSYELSVVAKLGFAPYFLIFWDCVRFACQAAIPVGPGRGSAVGCLLNYTLGITAIDPLANSLLFERFLNPERSNPPDIDLDVSPSGRERIIEYLFEKYGQTHTSQVVAFGALGPKDALREVGRFLEMDEDQIDPVLKLIPDWGLSLDRAVEQVPPLAQVAVGGGPEARLITWARQLEGKVRHLSVHAAAVLIAPSELTDYVPLHRMAGTNHLLTQFDGPTCEELGLLKMDIIALKELDQIAAAVALIRKKAPRFDLAQVTWDDSATLALFARGETTGVFQFESPPMGEYLTRLNPTSLEDLTALYALYRFGGSERIPSLIDRKHGREAIEYTHDLLKPILAETYGIIVYQEQIQRICHDLAGISLGRADGLRKAMARGLANMTEQYKKEFIAGAKHNEICQDVVQKIWDDMKLFSATCFNKAHAHSYTCIAFQCAYLKAHYPNEFHQAFTIENG